MGSRGGFCYSQEQAVLRALASSFLSLLLAATLMWGGCISCEQYFMWPNAKGCCAGKNHCKSKPVKRSSATDTKQIPGPECKQLSFGSQKSFNLYVDLPVSAEVKMDVPVPGAGMIVRCYDVSPVESSPPDLYVLHSTFLI